MEVKKNMFLRRYNTSKKSWIDCIRLSTYEPSDRRWYTTYFDDEYASIILELWSNQYDQFYTDGHDYTTSLPYLSYTQDLGFKPKGFIAYNDPNWTISVSASVSLFDDMREVYIYDTNVNGNPYNMIANYGSGSDRPATQSRIKIPVNRANQKYTVFIVGSK